MYLVGDEARAWGGNAWILQVYCPGPVKNFDTFLYFPNLNYPKEGYGGLIERVGDWAYVHE